MEFDLSKFSSSDRGKGAPKSARFPVQRSSSLLQVRDFLKKDVDTNSNIICENVDNVKEKEKQDLSDLIGLEEGHFYIVVCSAEMSSELEDYLNSLFCFIYLMPQRFT